MGESLVLELGSSYAISKRILSEFFDSYSAANATPRLLLETDPLTEHRSIRFACVRPEISSA